MALFGFGKDKKPQDGFPQTLAYLEDALRQRSPFVLMAAGRGETAAVLHSVEEDGRTFRLLPETRFQVEAGTKVDFTLIHDGLRMGASTRTAETREGVVVLRFPEALALMERRRQPRARINAKELATATALQDIFEGIGISGTVDNLAEGGVRVRVDKAITISTEKRLVLGTKLVQPGLAFMVLRLNRVPKCAPVMETPGRVVYLEQTGGGLMIGFAFDKPPQEVESSLRRLVAARAKPIPETLPNKHRRPKEPLPEPEPELPDAPPQAAAAADADADAAAPEPMAGSEPSEWLEPSELPDPAEPEDGPDPAVDPLPSGRAGAERRVHIRLSLGAGFQARFLAGGGQVVDADLLDVSIGGCCLRLAPESCQDLESGSMLEAFHFLHRDLPNGEMPARVSWVLGKHGRDLPGLREARYCLVGLQFLAPPKVIEDGLEAYIAWHLDI